MKLSTAFALLGAASTAFPGVSAHEVVSCVVFVLYVIVVVSVLYVIVWVG